MVMGKLKIAMFTDGYEPQVHGVATSVKSAREGLEKRGHKVWVFCPAAKGIKGRRIYQLPSVPLPIYWNWRIGIIGGFFIKYGLKPPKINMSDLDIIHVHTPAGVGFDGLFLGKMLNVPVVMTYHTFFPKYVKYFFPWMPRFMQRLTRNIVDRFLSWFYNQSDAVIAPSEDVRDYLRKHGVKKPIFVVPSGIRMKFRTSRERARKKLGWTDKKVLIHVARLSPEKNIDFILRTMKKIEEERDDVWLYILSTGPEERKLKALARRLGLRRTVFTGYVDSRTLEMMYAGADVFVFASETDTQALVLMEAAFKGVPIVVRNAPVTSSFVRKYGGLVSNRDADDMKDKIYALLDDEGLRREISENYRRRVVRDFSIEKCVVDLEKVYKIAIEIKKRELRGKRRI